MSVFDPYHLPDDEEKMVDYGTETLTVSMVVHKKFILMEIRVLHNRTLIQKLCLNSISELNISCSKLCRISEHITVVLKPCTAVGIFF